MAKYLYVQGIYWEQKNYSVFVQLTRDLSFRHVFVEAEDVNKAYLHGQRKLPKLPDGAVFLNDYVVPLEEMPDTRAIRTGMKL